MYFLLRICMTCFLNRKNSNPQGNVSLGFPNLLSLTVHLPPCLSGAKTSWAANPGARKLSPAPLLFVQIGNPLYKRLAWNGIRSQTKGAMCTPSPEGGFAHGTTDTGKHGSRAYSNALLPKTTEVSEASQWLLATSTCRGSLSLNSSCWGSNSKCRLLPS